MGVAVVLMSGGMDSCVTAALALASGAEVAALHVGYGQLTAAREARAFEDICDTLRIRRRLTVGVDHLRAIGGSSLTDPTLTVPAGLPVDRAGVPSTYVPQRNGNLLMMAAAWAEVLHAEAIWAGLVEADGSGYPDCRRSFCDALEAAIAEGNPEGHPDPRLVTPLITMTKADIVRAGLAVAAPLGQTWSCYQSGTIACGVCDSCQLRRRGFDQAGIPDPIPYQV